MSNNHKKNQLILDVGFASDANPRFRCSMEDSHVLMKSFLNQDSKALYAIFDGHGGRDAADQIAQTFPEIFANHLKTLGEEQMHEVWRLTHQEVDEKLDEQAMQFQGAAAVSCFFSLNPNGTKNVYASNLGDARAVLCLPNKQEPIRLTYDHKASDRKEIQRITDAGGFVIASRVQGILSVSRALGDHGLKPFVSIVPHSKNIELTQSDLNEVRRPFVIIACDGLWDVFTDAEAVDIAKLELNEQSPKTEGKTPAERMAKRLVEEALRGGSTDNISVIVVIL
ncbi:hypothetical protein GEMRC1_012248 [Eukaryota sp. GEM-RC1]